MCFGGLGFLAGSERGFGVLGLVVRVVPGDGHPYMHSKVRRFHKSA